MTEAYETVKRELRKRENDSLIAKTILSQISKRSLFMIGAYNYVALTSRSPNVDGRGGVSFTIKGSKTVSSIKITLNWMDLYDVEFFKFDKREPSGMKLVSKVTDIYADVLALSISDETGLGVSV